MQTFLTRYGMWASARDLDPIRLFKQVVEAKQIAIFYADEDAQFPGNHPATKMWMGHEHYLFNYGSVMAAEYLRRDIGSPKQRNACFTMMSWFAAEQKQFRLDFPEVKATRPEWMISKEFILSHRGNLVRKDEAYYGRLFPRADRDRPYLWPLPSSQGYRYYLSAAEARRVNPLYLPSNWTVDWDTREVTFS